MKILVLGGTIFLGKHIVIEALRRGHEVTLFNRGKHNPDLFPDVEKVHGDRLEDLHLLSGRKFDRVIDTCGFFPRALRLSTEVFRENIPHYTFISSISVYGDLQEMGITEESETGKIEDESNEDFMSEAYGPLKKLSEDVVTNAYGDSALNIRAGLIVGEDDLSDRFSYWVLRTAKGGKMAVPDSFDMSVQFIDVKDLAEFTLNMSEKGTGGVFNVTGPEKRLTFGELLERCRSLTGAEPTYVKLSEKFLLDNNVGPYRELPLWVPKAWEGTNNVSISKALSHGMKIRPVDETIADVIGYDKARGDVELRAGLKPERESELIGLAEKQEEATGV